MNDHNQFEAKLDEIAAYVEDIGDEVLEEKLYGMMETEFQGETYSLTGHRCSTGESVYLVVGHPDVRFMSVVYILSMKRNAGLTVEKETAQYLVEDELENEDLLVEKAGDELLSRLSVDDRNALESYVYMFVSGGGNKTSIVRDDNETFSAYTVESMFFPFESGFDIREFQRSVQSTVTAGERGRRLLSRTLFVDMDEDAPEEATLDLHFGW